MEFNLERQLNINTMKKILFVISLISTISFSQTISEIESGESGLSVRNKLNAIIDKTDYEVIAGTIRYNPLIKKWYSIETSSHKALGVDSVVTNLASAYARVYFNADTVISFVCGVDESFAAKNFSVGASVSTDYADLYYYWNNKRVGGYVYYTGSAWATIGNVSVDSYGSGTLVVSHDSINATAISIAPRDGVYIVNMRSPGYTTTRFSFYDYAGELITSANTNMKFSFIRQELNPVRPDYNPDELDTNWIAGANIWFIGLVK